MGTGKDIHGPNLWRRWVGWWVLQRCRWPGRTPPCCRWRCSCCSTSLASWHKIISSITSISTWQWTSVLTWPPCRSCQYIPGHSEVYVYPYLATMQIMSIHSWPRWSVCLSLPGHYADHVYIHLPLWRVFLSLLATMQIKSIHTGTWPLWSAFYPYLATMQIMSI